MSEATCIELAHRVGVSRAAARVQLHLAAELKCPAITGPAHLDLAAERALLARAQRERIEMGNAQSRGELVPIVVLEQVIAKAAARVSGIFDGIPGALRRRSSLSKADLDFVAAEIARARNVVAAMSLADLAGEPAGHGRS